jgi:hypothetical protein
MILHTVFEVTLYYVVLPYYCFHGTRALLGFLVGYAGQTFAYSMYTGMALVLERDRARFWRSAYCLPLAAAYCIAINFLGCVVGVVKDIFLLGNSTNFAPEWTLMRGRCERIALSFRARRFLALSLRAMQYGDVPLGTFWLGWQETPFTPSGYEGWTTKKKPRAIFVNARRAVEATAAPVAMPLPRLPVAAAVAPAPPAPLESVPRLVSHPRLRPVNDLEEESAAETRHSLPSLPPPAGQKRAA